MSEAEDWKARYTREVRDWEATDELLRRAVSRLSIAAEGISADLDTILEDVQAHARAGDDGALTKDIERLSRQVRRMDSEDARADVSGADALNERDYCEALLDALELNPGRREALSQFRRRLPRMEPERCLAELAVQISGLLGEQREAASDGPVREVLLTLIDEVAVAQPGAGGLASLRETLERDRLDDWHRILERVVGEIRTLIQRMSRDKQALEKLMIEVSDELGDITEVLGDERSGLREGRDQALALHDIMREGVTRIQTHIDTETDIGHLKDGVSQSLEGIRSGIAEFVKKDGERFARSEARNQELQDRIDRLENETGQLKERLYRNREKLMFDTLTGVRSRLAYDELLAQEFSRYRRYSENFCLAVLDVDHFKKVNDRFGHAAGDKALKLMAGVVAERIRETDYLCRVGGEEFVLLLPRTGLQSGADLVERVRLSVGESEFHYQGQPVPITLSAGVTVVREDDTPETLFTRADDAMYRAKKGGRNRLVVLD